MSANPVLAGAEATCGVLEQGMGVVLGAGRDIGGPYSVYPP